MAAVGGVIAASRVLGVSNQSGSGSLLLQAIAAAVVGGVSLLGGRGSVWAALLGALVIGSISNGMDLLDYSTSAKLIVQGACSSPRRRAVSGVRGRPEALTVPGRSANRSRG